MRRKRRKRRKTNSFKEKEYKLMQREGIETHPKRRKTNSS